MLTWQYATPEEFNPVMDIFKSSELGKGKAFPDIFRRITIPLLLKQLITFYRDGKFCGFTTFAFLSKKAEEHMPTTGILPTDWRSGDIFWAVDYVVNNEGFRPLRMVTRALGVKKCRYFRHKFKEIREVRVI